MNNMYCRGIIIVIYFLSEVLLSSYELLLSDVSPELKEHYN